VEASAPSLHLLGNAEPSCLWSGASNLLGRLFLVWGLPCQVGTGPDDTLALRVRNTKILVCVCVCGGAVPVGARNKDLGSSL
jgi:hypothetical protein